MPENNLKNIFSQISNNWSSYLEHCQSEDQPNLFRVKSDHFLYDSFKTELENKFKTLIDTKKYH